MPLGRHQGLGVLEGAPPKPLAPEAALVPPREVQPAHRGRLPVQDEDLVLEDGEPHGEEELPGFIP